MKFFRKEASVLDEPISAVLTSMNEFGPDSPEYPKLLEYLEKLIKLKQEGRGEINLNVLAQLAGYIAGILIIVGYERAHVFSSRAQNFLPKIG